MLQQSVERSFSVVLELRLAAVIEAGRLSPHQSGSSAHQPVEQDRNYAKLADRAPLALLMFRRYSDR
jgi:hypothetical protein